MGIIRWAFKYPDGLPGFFKEVNSCHVDPTHAPLTIILSAISIAGGANLGPEQAMVIKQFTLFIITSHYLTL